MSALRCLPSNWRPLGLASIAIAALGAEVRAGGVLVVDAAGAGAYTQIQAAIDAAIDGDTILVKAGSYTTFYLENKALDIVGAAGANVVIDGGARVAHVAAGERVLLANLEIRGTYVSGAPFAGRGLTVALCTGSVRVEACRLFGYSDSSSDQPGLLAIDSDGVVVTDCEIRGGSADLTIPSQNSGSAGLHVDHSQVALFDCSLFGGDGGMSDDWILNAGHGGAGVRVDNSAAGITGGFLYVAGCWLEGGDGGLLDDLDALHTGAAGDGGFGIRADDGYQVVVMDNVYVPGFAGGATGGVGWGGADGLPIGLFGGATASYLPAAARELELDAPAVEATSFALTLNAQPGDFALALVSTADAAAFYPAWNGLLLAAAPLVFPLGTVGPAGTWSATVPLGPLAAGEFALSLAIQGVVVEPGLSIVLGSSRRQIILAAGL